MKGGTQVIILGVHRSGTSLIASLIEGMGVWFARENEAMEAKEDNPLGFWERQDIVDLNDRMLKGVGLNWYSLSEGLNDEQITQLREQFSDPIQKIISKLDEHGVWMIKDPRLCLTWPVWQAFLDDPKIVTVVRHPLSVARSLYRRDGMPIRVGLALWARQMKALARAASEQKIIHVVHEDFLHNPLKGSTGLSEELIAYAPRLHQLAEKDIHERFNPDLVHQKGDNVELEKLAPGMRELWEMAQAANFSELATIELSTQDWLSDDLVETWESLAEYKQESLIKGWNIVEKKKNIFEQQNTISEQQNTISEQQEKLEHLNTIAESMAAYRVSRQYRFSQIPNQIYRLIGKKPAPGAIEKIEESLAEAGWTLVSEKNEGVFSRITSTIASDPLEFIRGINLSRIRTAGKMLISREARSNLPQVLARYKKAHSNIHLKLYKPGSVAADDIQLACSPFPVVSIIVPVFNEYETTLACLKSIAEFTDEGIQYEVILADDCSSDATQNISQAVEGLRIIRPETNQGFLGNCNNAAAEAQGEYLLFLNNDTNVQPGWLEELLAIAEADPSVGIVGPRFLYPDGRLQEAGGIIFQDASGWNYGRLDDPARPEYSFIRDVDYISGACLLVKHELWDKSGGFDQRFAPAYYEDTDLCFTARQSGYRVIYTPFSMVVHYEGVSHGTDESSGIKKQQVINQKVFRQKWAELLDKEQYDSSKQLFAARHHGKPRGTVLIIDHYVPMHDRDAGSRSTRQYLELLVKENVRVIFMGDNFYPHQPYTEELQRLGIEVLYGEYYKKHWQDWLQYNAQWIDCIYSHRPHITGKYLDTLTTLEPRPRIVYFGHDLHYLRCQREAGISPDKRRQLLTEAAKWKEKEFYIMRKVDLSLFPAEYEVQEIIAEDPDINVSSIPLMIYPDVNDHDDTRHTCNAPELLFVGGFGHPPNLDGLQWFMAEVWPLVLASRKDSRLTIIGSKCPDEVKKLNGDNVRVLGEVDDSTLEKSYTNARLAIVPLRFGAGIKGKVLEAMSKGVAVCTTPVGAEGLPDREGYISIASDEKEFSHNILHLLDNDDALSHQVELASAILADEFSYQKAVSTILPDLGL
jgi:GT2 family glycosyltransferase